jgi:protein TonB
LPVPVENKAAGAEIALARKRVEQLEREARQLVTQARSQAAVAPRVEAQQPREAAETAPSAADILSRGAEIARLEAQIAREWESYQQRPRRRFIGARAQEFRFARYIEDWRAKIERVGELNYPQAARDRKIYGSMVVTVSIKADGSLERVEINRPSGQRILDAAALRIVQLAAPFAPFPADIARDTDILSITRTWIFTRSDQLVTQ